MLRWLGALSLFFALVCGASANDEGDKLVSQIDAMKRPQFDRNAPRDEQLKASADFTRQRNDLIWKLFLADPKHPRTLSLMEERWEIFEGGSVNGTEMRARLLADVEKVLAMKPAPEFVELAKYYRAVSKFESWIADPSDAIAPSDAFAKEFPQSKRGPMLYINAAYSTADNQKPKLFKALLASYPTCSFAPIARGVVRRSEATGKPFALKFKDAIGGTEVDVESMKGKVILIDFWATWCGPCVDKMPELKKLNQTYAKQGLQIIGVSLDQSEEAGGAAKLKDFVSKNGITWPQHYEGRMQDNELAQSWGILMIPTVFLIDKKGNLREVNPKDLEGTIKSLIEEK